MIAEEEMKQYLSLLCDDVIPKLVTSATVLEAMDHIINSCEDLGLDIEVAFAFAFSSGTADATKAIRRKNEVTK